MLWLVFLIDGLIIAFVAFEVFDSSRKIRDATIFGGKDSNFLSRNSNGWALDWLTLLKYLGGAEKFVHQ